MNRIAANKEPWTLVVPSLKDPRCTIAAALTLWTVLGQTAYYFNRDPLQLGVAIASACLLDFAITAFWRRQLAVPLSAYITAMSVAILLESYDWRVFVVAPAWGILSKYLLRDRTRHFFNPSNFAIVTALVFGHGLASVAPGSQWGADYRVAFVIIGLGLIMMTRLKLLDLALAWMGGFVLMSLLRMALGQGGLVFALGPMTGAEFALFTFSMLPDPKTSPQPGSAASVGGFPLPLWMACCATWKSATRCSMPCSFTARFCPSLASWPPGPAFRKPRYGEPSKSLSALRLPPRLDLRRREG